jgi:serine phosphatase RsbU (regulator of sigma subunit)
MWPGLLLFGMMWGASLPILTASAQAPQPKTRLTAQQGIMDLRAWSPSEQPEVSLSGNWAFYWDQHITPIELVAKSPAPTGYFPVPASWDSYEIKGEKLPNQGKATYLLEVLLPESDAPLVLDVPFVWSSYRVWVNGRLEASSGVPGLSQQTTMPVFLKSFVPLPEGTQKLSILLEVSDFESSTPGLLETPVIGTRTSILAQRDFGNALNMAVIGALLVLAIYHLFFYAFRRKERAMLAFALICLAVIVRFAVFGDHHIYEWLVRYSGLLNFYVQGPIYYTATFLLGVFVIFYLYELFPDDVWGRAFQLGLILAAVAIIAAVVLPFAWFGILVTGLIAIVAAYVIFTIVKAAWLGRPQARLLLVGLSGMLLAGAHDALATANIYILTETELLTYGFLFFIFVQFVVVSRRFSTTFAAVEDLTENLERKVEQRTHELAQANEEIGQKNQDITDSIQYAKRIQLSILPDTRQLSERLPQSFLHYQPKDIVSGDFYWFHQREDGTLTVAIADATGHGVPGAFMSVLGVNLLSRAVHELTAPDPATLLTAVHQWVRQALKQDQVRASNEKTEDGMEMAMIQLTPDGTLFYAGANRPLLRFRDGAMDEIAPVKHAIGGSDLVSTSMAVFETHRLDTRPGDVYYLFTDGATDQFGGDGETRRRFSGKRFRSLLTEIISLPITQQRDRIANALDTWRGSGNQTDDILVMGFRIAG